MNLSRNCSERISFMCREHWKKYIIWSTVFRLLPKSADNNWISLRIMSGKSGTNKKRPTQSTRPYPQHPTEPSTSSNQASRPTESSWLYPHLPAQPSTSSNRMRTRYSTRQSSVNSQQGKLTSEDFYSQKGTDHHDTKPSSTQDVDGRQWDIFKSNFSLFKGRFEFQNSLQPGLLKARIHFQFNSN